MKMKFRGGKCYYSQLSIEEIEQIIEHDIHKDMFYLALYNNIRTSAFDPVQSNVYDFKITWSGLLPMYGIKGTVISKAEHRLVSMHVFIGAAFWFIILLHLYFFLIGLLLLASVVFGTAIDPIKDIKSSGFMLFVVIATFYFIIWQYNLQPLYYVKRKLMEKLKLTSDI